MDGIKDEIRLPEVFLERVKGQLGEELPSFLSALEGPPVRGLRMNPFRKGWEKPFRDAAAPVPWIRSGWEIPAESGAGTTIAHEAGAFYLQDPSAMLPAAVLAAQPGERILDLCAAPGGKSTQIGADLDGQGTLICNEPIPSRAAVLSRNVERMGIPNAVVTCAYPEKLAESWEESFDGVMADVPCSGEGMFGRHPESRAEWSPEKAEGCAERQRRILEEAARLVRPGGRLVYATCTWNPAENEEQMEAFLCRHPEFMPESFSVPGAEGKDGLFTCWPHRVRGGGQFTAKLRKKGAGEPAVWDGEKDFPISRENRSAWQAGGIRTAEPRALFGQTLVWIPEIPDLKGIRVLRMGLHVGTVRGKVFLPDHAAALGKERPLMPETELDEESAGRFMAGESLEGGVQGWTLMTWKGLVLGWGKGSDGMIRNHYPKGLRNAKLTG